MTFFRISHGKCLIQSPESISEDEFVSIVGPVKNNGRVEFFVLDDYPDIFVKVPDGIGVEITSR